MTSSVSADSLHRQGPVNRLAVRPATAEINALDNVSLRRNSARIGRSLFNSSTARMV
jgi:hypothetical protein